MGKLNVGSGQAVATVLRGHYETVEIEYVNGRKRGIRMLIVSGSFAQLMVFYESFQTHLVPTWRGRKRFEKLYERNQENAKKEGLLRYQAEDNVRWGDDFLDRDDDRESLVRSLEHAIAETGIELESEAVVV